MPTPPPATSSSVASQAASRTVVDIVGGENAVLNENEQTNRDVDKSKAEQQQPEQQAAKSSDKAR